ncbi:PREDICTED: zinc finger MYM-type protein 1-like, partial [Vollenhovia emeryi]|uniref:zinc finger MYM-type protein 1-like n=1 Tax=Vollenhovia emeryi TaxID=411798 RepID=UPI0005F3A4D0
MAGKNKGVQALLNEKNYLALFVPSNSNTRWSSKNQAISALYSELPNVIKALTEIENSHINPESSSTANSLLKQIDYEFICQLVMWEHILSKFDRINIAIQRKNMDLTSVSKLLESLKEDTKELRNTGFDEVYQQALIICDQMGIDTDFKNKRKRTIKKVSIDESTDENYTLTEKERFKILYIEVLDRIYNEIEWRFETLNKVAADFEFLSGQFLITQKIDQLKKHSADLALKYSNDLNANELYEEIVSARNLLKTIKLSDASKMLHLDILQLIIDYNLLPSCPNMSVAYRIYLTIPVTSASCERSFSKLKLIKNYLRSTMAQKRLSNLALIAIEKSIARSLKYDELVNEFANVKARK